MQVIGREELNLIYAATGARTITVGHLSQDPSIPAYVDTDHMLAKHFAVVGSTGVGKSRAVAAILWQDDRGAAGAAGAAARRAQRVPGRLREPRQRRRGREPAAAVLAVQLRGDLERHLRRQAAAAEEAGILAELIPVAKAKYQAGPERLTSSGGPARHGGFTADTPSPYQLQDLLGLIHERMGKLENRSSGMSHHRLVGRIDTIRNDPRYEFMFKQATLGGDTMAAVLDQVFSLEAEDRPLTILKLASLPDEVVDAVVCVLARLAFDFALWSDGAIPILLACEEAHRYASADQHRASPRPGGR